MEFETCRIVNTDNFNGGYPNESFVEGLMHLSTEEQAKKIADAINQVVKMPYTLQPGFEP